MYCSVTYTSKLSQKEKMSQIHFRPTVYFAIFPNESVIYATRAQIPDVIHDALVEMYGATRLRKMPLEGKDFWSLRQLHFNKVHKGMLCRRPVPDSHPIDSDVDEEAPGMACYSYKHAKKFLSTFLLQSWKMMPFKTKTKTGRNQRAHTIVSISSLRKTQRSQSLPYL